MIFQIAMGSTDSHPQVFQVSDVEYGIPDLEWDMAVRDQYHMRVGRVIDRARSS